MHLFEFNTPAFKSFAVDNWWKPAPVEVENLAVAILGNSNSGAWLRQNGQFVVIASVKRGAMAEKLQAEFSALNAETDKILSTGQPDAALRAAAFYHLRFENIHPLREGNGRVGRVILAAQLRQSLGFPIEEFSAQFNAHINDYMMAFPTNNPRIMFELMLDVLARLTGRVVAEESSELPAPILPLFPDRRPLVKTSSQQPHNKPMARPIQRGGNYFRRNFG